MFSIVVRQGDQLPVGKIVHAWVLTCGALYLIVQR